MAATSDPSSPTNDGARKNLFVEADPEYDELSSPPAGSSSAIDTRSAGGLRQGRGLVVPVDASSMASAAQADAARFTRGTHRLRPAACIRRAQASVRRSWPPAECSVAWHRDGTVR